jgi:hypothetical protein
VVWVTNRPVVFSPVLIHLVVSQRFRCDVLRIAAGVARCACPYYLLPVVLVLPVTIVIDTALGRLLILSPAKSQSALATALQ